VKVLFDTRHDEAMNRNHNLRHIAIRWLGLALPLTVAPCLQADPSYPTAVQADSPLAYYRFGDSLVRSNVFVNIGSSGAAGNATNTLNVHAFSGALAGSGDKAQFFDMGTSWAMIPYNAAMNPDNTKPFTIEAWFLPTSDQISGGQCPINNRLAGSAPDRMGWVFFQRSPDATYIGKAGNEGIGWNCRMYSGSGGSTGLDVVSQVPYELGKWTHVVVIYDVVDPVTNASLTIYINGVAANTNVWTGGSSGTQLGYAANAAGTDVALSFGAYNNTSGAGGNPYFGGIDEFAFYAAKLTPEQILSHYQNGTNANRTTPYNQLISSANPVTYLRLNELSPGADLAINMGDAHAAANAPYTAAVKHPGGSALANRPDDGSFSGTFRNGGGTRVDIPWLADNNPDSSIPFTFETWLRPLNDRMSPGPSPVNNRYVSSGNRTGWVIYQRNPNDTYNGVPGSEGIGYNFRMYTGNGSTSQNVTTAVPYNLGEWQHLVITWQPLVDTGMTPSGSEQWQGVLTAYVNGTAVVTNGDVSNPGAGGVLYAANINPPESGDAADLAIGSYNAASNFGEEFEGDIDEVAFYNNYLLTADQILAHYQAGTNAHPATNYETLVLTAAYDPTSPQRTMPKTYLRFNEPAYFPATNSGTLNYVADADLVLTTNTAAGPSGSGFGTPNPAVPLDGAKGWVALNEPSALNISGAITMEAWINPAATQGDTAYIVAHGPPTPSNFDPGLVSTNAVSSSNEVFLRIEGGTNYSVGTSDGTTFHGAAAAIPAGDLGGNSWIYLAGTYDGANWRLFRNGAQVASVADTVGALPDSTAEWAIGSTGDGWGQLFAGMIDEVAIYGKALTTGQIQAHYNAASSQPITLSIQKSGNGYAIVYSGGTLQSANTINGQFNDVSNASSPYPIPAGTTIIFYRVKQ
jgi:hypothetical protein